MDELDELDRESSSQWQLAMALAKAMLGATLLTLPFAGSQLGWVLSVAMLASVALLTYATLEAIARLSDTCLPPATTYAQVVTARLSPLGGSILQVCVSSRKFCLRSCVLQGPAGPCQQHATSVRHLCVAWQWAPSQQHHAASYIFLSDFGLLSANTICVSRHVSALAPGVGAGAGAGAAWLSKS